MVLAVDCDGMYCHCGLGWEIDRASTCAFDVFEKDKWRILKYSTIIGFFVPYLLLLVVVGDSRVRLLFVLFWVMSKCSVVFRDQLIPTILFYDK